MCVLRAFEFVMVLVELGLCQRGILRMLAFLLPFLSAPLLQPERFDARFSRVPKKPTFVMVLFLGANLSVTSFPFSFDVMGYM